MRVWAPLFAVIAVAVASAGCTPDTTNVVPAGQTGDPKIALALLLPAGCKPQTETCQASADCCQGSVCTKQKVCAPPTKTDLCFALDQTDDPVVPIGAVLQQVDLRPPGVCTIHTQCGHLALYMDHFVDDKTPATHLNSESAAPYVEGHLRHFADRFSKFQLTVAVLLDDETPLMDHADAAQPVQASIAVDVKASCP